MVEGKIDQTTATEVLEADFAEDEAEATETNSCANSVIKEATLPLFAGTDLIVISWEDHQIKIQMPSWQLLR